MESLYTHGVSIIMPVYNTPVVDLTESVKSILQQTCSDWELIIVDDGSNPEIAAYCDSFDDGKKVHILHINNKGVSYARNIGTSLAQKKYIMYVDADDVLAQNVIEDALNIAEKQHTDIVLGRQIKVENSASFYKKYNADKQCGNTIADKDELRKRFFGLKVDGLYSDEDGSYIGRGPVAKLIKRELATTNLFPEGLPIGEDIIWCMRLLNNSEHCYVSNNIWYGYIQHTSSAIHRYYGDREQICKKWINILYEENSSFLSNNPQAEAILLSKEFFSIVRYEILSNRDKDSLFHKNSRIKRMLAETPWNKLKDENIKYLSTGSRLFLILCRLSMGASSLYIALLIKSIVSHIRVGLKKNLINHTLDN